jgi:DNA-binding NtrC family response regulator
MSQNPTIMVIEDDKDSLFMYKEDLEEVGYRVLACESGLLAMSLLDNDSVDLIVTDIRMPDVDVTHLLGYLSLHFPKIPIILATAYPEYEYLLTKRGSTVKAYFMKPVDMKKLLETIAELLTK